MSVACPYCALDEPEQRVLFRDDLVLYLEDVRFQGALSHSGVIIPVLHRPTVFDLSDAEITATFRMLARVKAWIDAEFAPDGYNIGWNCGEVGGQSLLHAHLHVIPRFRHEPLAGQRHPVVSASRTPIVGTEAPSRGRPIPGKTCPRPSSSGRSSSA